MSLSLSILALGVAILAYVDSRRRRPQVTAAVGFYSDLEREWLRQALALAILDYGQDGGLERHRERIAFLQRLLKNLSEIR